MRLTIMFTRAFAKRSENCKMAKVKAGEVDHTLEYLLSIPTGRVVGGRCSIGFRHTSFRTWGLGESSCQGTYENLNS